MRNLMAALLLAGALLAVRPATPAAVAQSPCDVLGGTVDGQMCQVHVSNSTYRLNLTFPMDYADENALTEYLIQNRDGFVNVAQMPGSRGLPYEMDATSEQHHSGQPPHGTQSVVLKFFQAVGGPHPSTWYKAFNYDLDQHRPITFDTLFAPGTQPLNAIFPIVQRELERQTGIYGGVLHGAGHDPSHYQNFAITDDALIFYFAPGEILPTAAGEVRAQVPRNAIPPLAI